MRTGLIFLALLGACSDLPELPAPLAHPVHDLALADMHLITIDDADTMDAGTVSYAGLPIPHAVMTTSDGTTDPAPAIPELPIATSAAVGRAHACVLSRGDVYCWGDNAHGALGAHRACPGTTDANGDATCPLDAEIMPTLPKISAIAAGDDMTCAIAIDDGRVYCWGSALDGRLGGSFVSALGTPEPVALPDPVVTLRIQNDRACAIDTNQLAWCWGNGLGATPVRQRMTGVVDIALGAHHSCAISASDGFQCWGADRNGESGDFAVAKKCGTQTPFCEVAPTTIPLDATRVVVGERHTCALTRAGTVDCWGSNELGQLGRQDSFLVGEIAVARDGIIALQAAYAKTCAIDVDHIAWCWGDYRDAAGDRVYQ